MNRQTIQTVCKRRHPHRTGGSFPALLLLAATSLLQACGSGSGDTATPLPVQNTSTGATGDLMIAISDAPGDFLMYAVDVVQLTLHRANGDVVETLPFSTRIDFSELVEVSEFLTVASVPAGTYESVDLKLDFSSAEIVVQGASGTALPATAVDADGNPLGIVDISVDLTTADMIRIAPGIPAAFSIDFDLDASNDINFAASPPVVSVDPLLLASAELEADREHRARGALAAVDETGQQFTLKVRPFRVRDGSFGRLTVAVDDDTQYEVDGVGLVGAAGLEAMSALPANAPVIAGGGIDNMHVLADTVVAGSSVPWTSHDAVKGIVAARSGDTLSVRGARIEYTDGTEVYRGVGTVLLGPGTRVSAPGIDHTRLSTQSISVGQRIVAIGEMSDDHTLDATNSHVLMKMNQLTATVVDAEPLAVDVALINARRPDVYDFGGTGVDPALDADPDYYEIDTGSLVLESIARGDLVRVRGLVNDFGAAPADFNALTVIDVLLDPRPALFNAIWPEGTQMPFYSVADNEINVNLSGARAMLKLRGVPMGMTGASESMLLRATDTDRGLYAVKVRGSGEIHMYRSFAGLVGELERQLNAGAGLHRLSANGHYNVGSNALTPVRASFVFKSANGPH